MTLIIAQGDGFYGVVIMTTDRPLSEIAEALTTLPEFFDVEISPPERNLSGEINVSAAFVADLWKPINKQDSVTIRATPAPQHMQPQPNPICIMDTGSGTIDMQAIQTLASKL